MRGADVMNVKCDFEEIAVENIRAMINVCTDSRRSVVKCTKSRLVTF